MGDDSGSEHQERPIAWPLDRSRYTVRYRRILPSTHESLQIAVAAMMRAAGKCRLPRGLRADLEIVFREALANAIHHGNGLEASKRVFVRCYGAPGGELLVLVRDDGKGFDPGSVPDPREGDRRLLHHGRGLLLIRELMDHVEYRKQGCEILMFKRFVSPPERRKKKRS